MSRLIASIIHPFRLFTQSIHLAGQGPAGVGNSLAKPSNYLLSTIRTKVRCYFPRPNEVRRVRRHGWNTRISTPNGRRVIMRRLLKGRYVLTH